MANVLGARGVVGSSFLILFATLAVALASCGGGKAKPDGGNQSCQNSLECPSNMVCDRSIAQCVDCLSAADCSANNDCTAHRCVSFVPCANSLECPQNQVCNAAAGRCVACLTDADCADDTMTCVANTCRTKCASDRTCTPLGLLCDLSSGSCVRCIAATDCPTGQSCQANSCVTAGGVGGAGGTTGAGGGGMAGTTGAGTAGTTGAGTAGTTGAGTAGTTGAGTAGTTGAGTAGTTGAGTAGTTGAGGGTAGTTGAGGVGTAGTTGAGGSAGTTGTAGTSGNTCGAVFDVSSGGFVTAPAAGGACWHGYAFDVTDTGSGSGSAISPANFSMCGPPCMLRMMGTVGAATVANNYSGYALLAFNIGQSTGSTATPTVVPTGSSVTIKFTASTGGLPLRAQLSSGSATPWCYTITSVDTVTIPYSAFNTACWNNGGTAYAKQAIQHIGLVVPGGATATANVSVEILSVKENP